MIGLEHALSNLEFIDSTTAHSLFISDTNGEVNGSEHTTFIFYSMSFILEHSFSRFIATAHT